jgi:hypothetical protein
MKYALYPTRDLPKKLDSLSWVAGDSGDHLPKLVEHLIQGCPAGLILFRGRRSTELLWQTNGRWFSHPHFPKRKKELDFAHVERVCLQDEPEGGDLESVLKRIMNFI